MHADGCCAVMCGMQEVKCRWSIQMCSNMTEIRKIVYSVEAKFCFEQVYWVEVQRGNSTCVGDSGKGVKSANKIYAH